MQMDDKKTFEAGTLAEANSQADEWWKKRRGLRLIHRSQVTVGWGPFLSQAERFAVTIHFERENSG